MPGARTGLHERRALPGLDLHLEGQQAGHEGHRAGELGGEEHDVGDGPHRRDGGDGASGALAVGGGDRHAPESAEVSAGHGALHLTDQRRHPRLEPDVGLSAGRNALLSRVQTPYFLLLDDDFEFTAETKIEKLASVVARGEADLVAGACIWCKPKL